MIEKWFGDVKAGPFAEPPTIPGVMLTGVQKKPLPTACSCQTLRRVVDARHLETGDAELDVLSDSSPGQELAASTSGSCTHARSRKTCRRARTRRRFRRTFSSRPRRDRDITVDELQKVIDEEIARLQREAPSDHEVQRALNQIEASFYNRMERVGGFGGTADQLNAYYTNTGDPDWFNEDLARYRALSPSDIRAAADAFLPSERRVELTVVPEPKQQ